MPSVSGNFAGLIERVRTGSEEAAHELVSSYGPHVIRAVRRRLNRQLRSKFDSIDFVQSVWKSFFERLPTLPELSDPGSLVGFLSQMASHKVIDENRRRLDTRCCNVTRETPLDERDPLVKEALGRQAATPSEVAMAREEWGRLTGDGQDRDQEVLRLRMEGHRYRDIAQRFGLNERTVRRIVQQRYKPSLE